MFQLPKERVGRAGLAIGKLLFIKNLKCGYRDAPPRPHSPVARTPPTTEIVDFPLPPHFFSLLSRPRRRKKGVWGVDDWIFHYGATLSTLLD